MKSLEIRGELPRMNDAELHFMDHITADPAEYVRAIILDRTDSLSSGEKMLMPFLYQDCERQAAIIVEAQRVGDEELVRQLSFAAAQSKKDDSGFTDLVSKAHGEGQDQIIRAATTIIFASALLEQNAQRVNNT